ncbi:MAG: hypothetical protein MAG431_01546 [Chloroflexi bacterium]|nr:hypothetical protein [Chloroflexota bacterium]
MCSIKSLQKRADFPLCFVNWTFINLILGSTQTRKAARRKKYVVSVAKFSRIRRLESNIYGKQNTYAKNLVKSKRYVLVAENEEGESLRNIHGEIRLLAQTQTKSKKSVCTVLGEKKFV